MRHIRNSSVRTWRTDPGVHEHSPFSRARGSFDTASLEPSRTAPRHQLEGPPPTRTLVLLVLHHERTWLLLLLRHVLAMNQSLGSLGVLEDGGGRGRDLGDHVLDWRLAAHEEPDEKSRLEGLQTSGESLSACANLKIIEAEVRTTSGTRAALTRTSKMSQKLFS